ncbi:hypothetical protein Tco_0882655, partial [Tanacetum coccineum]
VAVSSSLRLLEPKRTIESRAKRSSINLVRTQHPSETMVFHNEDGNPARANIKQALGYLKDGDGDGNSQLLRYQVGRGVSKTTYKLFSMLNAPWSTCDQKFQVGIVSPDRSIHNTSAYNSGNNLDSITGLKQNTCVSRLKQHEFHPVEFTKNKEIGNGRAMNSPFGVK